MGETKLFNRVYNDIKRRREKILSGKINCIPCTFPRFSTEWPGIEQSKYYLISAQQKVGKTQFADKMFLYDPFFYAFNNPDGNAWYFFLVDRNSSGVSCYMSDTLSVT